MDRNGNPVEFDDEPEADDDDDDDDDEGKCNSNIIFNND